MSLFEILCLANSRKHGGKCIAGLRTDGKGWIRPVKQDEPLSRRDCILEDGSEVEVLDVIKIDLIGPQPAIRTKGSDRNIQQAEFLRKRLLALQKKDRNLSVRIERLKKRMASNQELRFVTPNPSLF